MKNIILGFTILFLLATCKKKEDTPTPSTPVSTATKFSVLYNGNGNTGGTVPKDGNAYDNGSSAVILGNNGNLVKPGYSFIGWNTVSDGTGTNLLPGSTITTGNSNLTLYAKWWNNSAGSLYTIVYSGNGNTSGTIPVDNTYYTPGSQLTVKGNTGGLVMSGNSFKSWNTLQNGTGQSYSPGDKITIQGNFTLYAIYGNVASSGKYVGFNAGGQVKTKSSYTSSWYTQDLDDTFGSSNLVSVVWDGSKYAGFNAGGQVKTKSSYTSSWYTQDLDDTFGSSNLVSVVWDGSKYVGFNAGGQVKTKSSYTSSWYTQDLDDTFGSSNLVSVVWDGSKYVGFNASGQVKTKSSYTSSWYTQDLDDTFGSSNLVSVVWDGSKYVGVNASGQVKTKSSYTSSWYTQDLDDTFGSSNLVCLVYD